MSDLQLLPLLPAPKDAATFEDKLCALSFLERDALLKLRKFLQTERENVFVHPSFLGMVNGFLNRHIGRAGRLAFYSWAFARRVEHGKIGVENGLYVYEAFNLVVWVKPVKLPPPATGWEYRGEAQQHIRALVRLFSEGVGQLEMDLNSQ